MIMPQTDELLSSWLHRLAYENGIAPHAFARVLGLHVGMWSPLLDLKLAGNIAGLLNVHTGMSGNQLYAITLSKAVPTQLLILLRRSSRYEGSTWLQFCPQCLAEDEQPYFRRRWRLATRIACAKHGYRLRDRCTVCRSRVAAFSQNELVPQHYCSDCGFDLRRASNVHIYPETRMFDRCLDEICTFDAMTASPFGPELIRQLLNVPSLTKFFATNTLISLSTAARTRCVLYLNPPDRYPANPDYEDHALAAVDLLQRHIPPASDHGAWIELLAKTLLPRASRRGDTFAEEAPSSALRHLLAAYACNNGLLSDRRTKQYRQRHDRCDADLTKALSL